MKYRRLFIVVLSASMIFGGVMSAGAALSVSLTAPDSGAIFTPGTNVLLIAGVIPGTAGITRVEFFADGKKLGEATQSPYVYTWTAPAAANYLITARVTDASAGKDTSAGIAVKIPRNQAYWPFAQNSPWNTPLGDSAVYEAETSPRYGATNPLGDDMTCLNWSHPIWLASPTDTMRNMYRTYPGSIFLSMRVPANAAPDPEADGHMHVIDETRTFVVEMYAAVRTADRGWRGGDAGDIKRNELKGAGIGAAAGDYSGTRAYGGSALGGIIRQGEFRNGIRHPVSCSMERASMNWQGTPDGTPYRWPATMADAGYNATYATTGNIYMGSLLALPKNLDITTIPGVGSSGQMYELARAMQDYGVYVCDASGDNINFSVEPAAAAEMPANFWGTLRSITDNLQVITNSAKTKVGGDGVRRRLPAPPYADEAPGLTLAGPATVGARNQITLLGTTTRGTDAGYNWYSSNSSLATVSASGIVTGVAPGIVTILAGGKNTKAAALKLVTVTASSGTEISMPGQEEQIQLEVSPNPFNPQTEFRIQDSHLRQGFGGQAGFNRNFVQLRIYNAKGVLVQTLINQPMEPGRHTVTWSATGMPSGIYVARLIAGGAVVTRQLMLLK